VRVLITAAAGFNRSHLSDALLTAGHEVMISDNLSTGSIGNISHIKEERASSTTSDSITNEPACVRSSSIAPTWGFIRRGGRRQAMMSSSGAHDRNQSARATEVVLKTRQQKEDWS